MEMEDCVLNLEIDVNGEETFIVNKRIISSYSGRINEFVGKSKGRLKVIFNDFPGGAANFELITKFCYNKGNLNINPLNISNLTCAAHFMEITNLCEKTEKSLEDIRYWTWSELLIALKQFQNVSKSASSLSILDKFLDSLVGRISSTYETSPCSSASSSDSSVFRLSCDTRSTESLKNTSIRTTWWFDDLVSLDSFLIQALVRLMVSKNFDHGIISRFLFFYQKSSFGSLLKEEKIKVVEMVVDLLDSLDLRSVSHKSLFGMVRVCTNVNLNQSCREKMESMIGLQLDLATLDNLLVPSPIRKGYLYDVNLVLRFVKAFLGKEACWVPLSRLKKVGRLMDLYLAEVAPDPHLKPSKFLDLILALPDSSRDSYDGVYYALNLYLEVHSSLSEEQKTKICYGLNYEKLSSDTFNHLARNPKFPSKSAVQAMISQQKKLKGLLQDTNHAVASPDPPTSSSGLRDEGSNQIVLYAKKFNLTDENEKLKAHLQGMQWRVVELEKVCRKMQNQMTKMMKSRMSRHNAKSVPKLCS